MKITVYMYCTKCVCVCVGGGGWRCAVLVVQGFELTLLHVGRG